MEYSGSLKFSLEVESIWSIIEEWIETSSDTDIMNSK